VGVTIGIDLGTTNTAIAVFVKGRPKVLEDEKGYKVLPSVVCQKRDGSYIVGQAAKNRILTDPGATVYAVKRLIGRRHDSKQARDTARRMPYKVVAGPDGEAHVLLGDTPMSPAEVSAIILKVAKQIAERALGEKVDDAVITVPAYFNHSQRASTMEAARLAGLRCDRLLNEPTAAALAYGFRKDVERNVVIYDLGGGTFDVSVLHLSNGVYEVLATSGDTYLGGEDFDLRIVDWLADQFLAENRVDLREDATALQRLKDAAERAKCELSFTDSVTVLVPRITPTRNLEIQLTRQQLEGLVEDLVEGSISVTREAVSMAGLQLHQMDDVVLVGGQTRMPRVREAISALFGREPSRSVHPEEVVAIGAAVHAQTLDSPELSNTLLIDVTPFDLGIDSAGGFFSTIIERNTRIPFTKTRVFTTASDNQERARISVRQGVSRVAAENERLGEFVLDNLRSAARLERKIDVTFRIDANGMLHTTAIDRITGDRKQLTIRNYGERAMDPSLPDEEAVQREQELQTALGDRDAPRAIDSAAEAGGGGFLSGLFASLTGRGKKDAPAPVAVDEGAPVEPLDEPPPIPEVPELAPAPPRAPAAKSAIEMPTLAEDELQQLGAMPEDIPPDLPEDELYDGPARVGALVDDSTEMFALPDEPEPLDLPEDAFDAFEDDLSIPSALGDDDLAPVPIDEDELRPALLEEDLFYPDDMFSEPEPEPEPPPPPPPPPSRASRKPARLKISYRTASAFVREYRENLDRGSTFIKAEKPLKEQRDVVFEIGVPNVREPVRLSGVVTWSSRKRALAEGQQKGMEIEYRLTSSERERAYELLDQLESQAAG
jgi:molecular chaperone DnaK